MYKKYMHSGDRRTNPTPVNEGLISWAKGKIDNVKKSVSDNLAKRKAEIEAKGRERAKKEREEELARAEEYKKEVHEFRIKNGGKLTEPEAIKKADQIAKNVINRPEFKELKSIKTELKDSKSYIEDFLGYMEYEYSLFTFDFKTEPRSEAEQKYRAKLVKELADAIEVEFNKVDKTYNIHSSAYGKYGSVYLWNSIAEEYFR